MRTSRPAVPAILVIAAGLLATGAAAGASPAPVLPDEPWIVYQGSDRPGLTPLRLVRLDGSDDHVIPIDELPGYDVSHPAWSPDGSRIAFDLWTVQPGSPDRLSLWSASPEGGTPTLLADCALPCLQLAYPAWSPDGRELALIRYDLEPVGTWGPSAVEVLDVATGERRILTETADGTTAVYTPRWAPDGSAIVFVFETYPDATQATITSSVLATIPTDGSTTVPTVITPPDFVADAPDWGPDGRIAFSRFEGVAGRPATGMVAIIGADGSDLRVLDQAITGLAPAIEPTWTADGRLLVGTGDPAAGEQWLAWVDPATGSAERLPWSLVTARGVIVRTHHHLRPGG